MGNKRFKFESPAISAGENCRAAKQLRVPLLCSGYRPRSRRAPRRTERRDCEAQTLTKGNCGLMEVHAAHGAPQIEMVARCSALETAERVLVQVCRETAAFQTLRVVDWTGAAKLVPTALDRNESDFVQHLGERYQFASGSKVDSRHHHLLQRDGWMTRCNRHRTEKTAMWNQGNDVVAQYLRSAGEAEKND